MRIIPVINKIDLDVAEPERVAEEVKQAFGFIDDEIVFVSAKDGTGIPEILEAIVERVPPPTGSADSPLRALIFDSKYDPYKGAIAYVRVMDGQAPSGSRVKIMSTASASDALEVGVFAPEPTSIDPPDRRRSRLHRHRLEERRRRPRRRHGNARQRRRCRAAQRLPATQADGVRRPVPRRRRRHYLDMRVALEKLQLNDAALSYQPENSLALGSGFRCGFLGLLHMDIVQERLEREYDLNLLATSPKRRL